jgi:hypothetical protein
MNRIRVLLVLLTLWPVAAWAQSPAVTPLAEEPRLLTTAMSLLEDYNAGEGGEPRAGFYPEFGPTITGAGWITVGPGYRGYPWKHRAVIDMSAAVTWRAYKIAQARVEFPHLANGRLTVGSKAQWQDFTQVRYFGAGRDSQESGASDYRVQASNVVGYTAWRPRADLMLAATVGWLSRPSISSSIGPFDRDEPDTTTRHFGEPGTDVTRYPRYTHAELSIVNDSRDHPSYTTRGGVARAAWSTYRDQPTSAFAFDRTEVEVAYFAPLFRRVVIGVHAWGVFSHTREGRSIPFYMLPSLGGHNTLRGYADYRFHDRHLVVGNLEARVPLFAHVDVAAFYDAGNVAARVEDLDFDRESFGGGVRLHTDKTTVARFDVARSTEGWRFVLKLTDPFRLRRLAKRTALLSFVP